MSKGIVIKIWNVKEGSQNRSGAIQISDSINYITNSEKCDVRMEKTDSAAVDTTAQLGRELDYVSDDVKTLNGLYVGVRRVSDVSKATDEMMQVKEYYHKIGGRVALHGIISLDEEESVPQNAGKLMYLLDDLMESIFPEHQVVYAVHTNTENLHIHFIANTVGLDGKKIHMDKSFMRKVMEPEVNRLAMKYGFTPNEHWRQYPAEEGMSYVDQKILLRNLVDQAVEDAESFQDFIEILRGEKLTVNVGKHISLKAEGMHRAIRSSQLGKQYTLETIQNRILNKKVPLDYFFVGDYVREMPEERRYANTLGPMKKYNDMTPEEQMKIIHLLKEGRNPWQERYQGNWRLQNMSDELNKISFISDLKEIYGHRGDTLQSLKEEIIKRQKELAQEKKHIRKERQEHKLLIRLYEEMKQYEVRSYLYQYAGCKEYENEFLHYEELSERMWSRYGKKPSEVAKYAKHLEEQLLYAQAQYKELSGQYKAILRFENHMNNPRISDHATNLFDSIGFTKVKSAFEKYGILENSVKFIGGDRKSDLCLRVQICGMQIAGGVQMVCNITVFSSGGEVLEAFSSADMERKAFNRRIREVAQCYELDNCKTYTTMEDAFANHRRMEGRLP